MLVVLVVVVFVLVVLVLISGLLDGPPHWRRK